LLPFEVWFPTTVSKTMENGEEFSEDVFSISIHPLDCATTYHSMYTFGNHFRVASAKSHLLTRNSRVAATFEQESHSPLGDQYLVMASL